MLSNQEPVVRFHLPQELWVEPVHFLIDEHIGLMVANLSGEDLPDPRRVAIEVARDGPKERLAAPQYRLDGDLTHGSQSSSGRALRRPGFRGACIELRGPCLLRIFVVESDLLGFMAQGTQVG